MSPAGRADCGHVVPGNGRLFRDRARQPAGAGDDSARLHGLFPKRGNFLAAVGNLRSWRLCWQFRRGFKRAVRFPLFSIVLPETVREIRRSDNSSFWDQGYPALMLTDTSFLRNPHYHLASDTPETLDYERMAAVTQGVAGAIRHLGRRAR